MDLLIPSQMRSPDPERTEVSCSIYHICVFYIYVYSICMYVCIIYIMYVLYIYVCNVFLWLMYMIDRLIGWCIMIYLYIYVGSANHKEQFHLWKTTIMISLRTGSETLYINCICIWTYIMTYYMYQGQNMVIGLFCRPSFHYRESEING